MPGQEGQLGLVLTYTVNCKSIQTFLFLHALCY